MYGYFENNLSNWWVYIKNTILCVVDNKSDFFCKPRFLALLCSATK